MSNLFQRARSAIDGYVRRRRYEPEPGVWVVPKSRDEYTYHFESYTANVVAEIMLGPIDCVIYRSSVENWLPPHENEPLMEEDRERIIRCLCKYLDHSGWTYEIQ
jgi:hypothetical protein